MIREIDWTAAVGQRTRVYRNLNNGRMSLQQQCDRRWLVVGHVTDCIIRDVSFFIRETGRQQVIREHHKNVHAWGEGILVAQFDPDILAPIALGYDPYANKTFVLRQSETPISFCRYLVVRENQVFVTSDAIELESIQVTQIPLFGG